MRTGFPDDVTVQLPFVDRKPAPPVEAVSVTDTLPIAIAGTALTAIESAFVAVFGVAKLLLTCTVKFAVPVAVAVPPITATPLSVSAEGCTRSEGDFESGEIRRTLSDGARTIPRTDIFSARCAGGKCGRDTWAR